FGRSAAGMPLSAPQLKSTTNLGPSNPDGSQAAKASTGLAYIQPQGSPPTTCATAKDRAQSSEGRVVANHAETSALPRPMKAAGAATGKEEEAQPPCVFMNDQTQGPVNAPTTNSGRDRLPIPAKASTTNSGTESLPRPVNTPPINVGSTSLPTPEIEPDRVTQTDQDRWEALLASI